MKQSLFLFFLLLSEFLSAQGKFFGGNGDGFATATVTNLILPVSILNFAVYKNGRVNKAELGLIYNEAICSLQLQRSTDGNIFSVIDSIQPAHSAGTSRHFTFTDAAPVNGTNYYRVRINRCNASFLYSSTVSVKTENQNYLLYYSPADNSIHYTITEAGLLKLANGSGQITFTKKLIAGSGVLSLPPIGNGVYFMQFAREEPVKIVVHQ